MYMFACMGWCSVSKSQKDCVSKERNTTTNCIQFYLQQADIVHKLKRPFYLFILISACHHCYKSSQCSEEHNATLHLLIRYLFILYTFYCDMQIETHTLKAIAAFKVRTFHIFDILLLVIYFLAPSRRQKCCP